MNPKLIFVVGGNKGSPCPYDSAEIILNQPIFQELLGNSHFSKKYSSIIRNLLDVSRTL